ncbi:hypothetical protein [Arundinibacter roseus]|uniref:Uncharacterized protein n=1 Tax=Arundinibacter roseus TaxID=2070510 RepID=A0A4R4KQQ6_9BACT|nr:hypothetical protein [Arundinibacter roseus]TDB68959.1 hypothetical protein EZE20_01065 [Arundinibacter roseus]
MALNDPLKKAILNLPTREKDKLLLRLITKDRVLADKLHFELIEGSATVEERKSVIFEHIALLGKTNHSSAGWLMMDLRTLSGEITYHVKITKDKYGEIELLLRMLTTAFATHSEQLSNYNSRTDKCALYMAKKVKLVLARLAKLDEEYYVDFENEVNVLLQYIHSHCTRMYAAQLALPRQWP